MIPGMILQVVPVLLVISMELCGWKSHVKMYWRRAEGSTAVSGIWIENRGAATFPELVHRIFLEENPKLVNSRVSCKECPIPNPLKNVNTNGSRPFDPCPGVSENGYNKYMNIYEPRKVVGKMIQKTFKKKRSFGVPQNLRLQMHGVLPTVESGKPAPWIEVKGRENGWKWAIFNGIPVGWWSSMDWLGTSLSEKPESLVDFWPTKRSDSGGVAHLLGELRWSSKWRRGQWKLVLPFKHAINGWKFTEHG